jgi:hypothetical protein
VEFAEASAVSGPPTSVVEGSISSPERVVEIVRLRAVAKIL